MVCELSQAVQRRLWAIKNIFVWWDFAKLIVMLVDLFCFFFFACEAWLQLLIWMTSGQPMRDLVDGMVRQWFFRIDLGERLFLSAVEVLIPHVNPIGRSWYVGSWQWGHDPRGIPCTFQYLGFNEGHVFTLSDLLFFVFTKFSNYLRLFFLNVRRI